MKTLHTTAASEQPYMATTGPIQLASPEADSVWLMARVETIDPHAFEQGHDGAYTRALERLAVQLRDELHIATGIAKHHIALSGSGCACRLKGQAFCEKHDS